MRTNRQNGEPKNYFKTTVAFLMWRRTFVTWMSVCFCQLWNKNCKIDWVKKAKQKVIAFILSEFEVVIRKITLEKHFLEKQTMKDSHDVYQ